MRDDGRPAPGAVTRLLEELADAPPSEVGEGWSSWLAPGVKVGPVELVREIGRGGFGVVWEAVDRQSGRHVAFKAVRPGGKAGIREARLLHEAEVAGRIVHPGIVSLLDVGQGAHGPYLVLELLRGWTLAERLDYGPLPPSEALRIVVATTRAVAHAHANGVVHRDLKPANVFLCEDGAVKVLDFGLAHAFGHARSGGGTPAYMAPEQWRGAPEDERTDVFALGVLLHRLLAGEPPFPDDGGRTAQGPEPAPALEVAGAPSIGPLLQLMLKKDPVRPAAGRRAGPSRDRGRHRGAVPRPGRRGLGAGAGASGSHGRRPGLRFLPARPAVPQGPAEGQPPLRLRDVLEGDRGRSALRAGARRPGRGRGPAADALPIRRTGSSSASPRRPASGPWSSIRGSPRPTPPAGSPSSSPGASRRPRRSSSSPSTADPSRPEARYFYARACFQQGRHELAARLCREANAVREDYQAAFFAAQASEAGGASEAAAEAYRVALGVCERHMEMNPDDPRAATMRAVCLARTGRRDDGLHWARQALAIDPLDAGVRYNVACLYAVEGALDDALTCLEEVVRAGFRNREWMERDPDLSSLRGLPRFQALMDGMAASPPAGPRPVTSGT